VIPKLEIDSDITILSPIDSLSKPANDVKTHNYALISFLSERKVPLGEDGLRQARTIYIGIVAVILSLILSSNKQRKKLPIYLILLFLIPLMYALDVHLKDLYHRQNFCEGIAVKNMVILINKDSINTTWYSLDFENVNTYWKAGAEKPKRWLRKFLKIFRPDGEQWVYFLIPWIVLYIFTAIELVKSTKKRPET
jgi:hypothetical protein